MINFTTGDLLQSSAEALVNTVNCEGYMGKGIAYQFKLKYPKNNQDYVRACRSGCLVPGTLHYFYEDDKLIINFPTKNKWREKSKIEYITTGLDELVKLVNRLNIRSIAIPPLGSGNGGLIWNDVKTIILDKVSVIAKNVDIYIYEPSKGYRALPVEEPKLSTSALVLMEIKSRLKKFDALRLQKAAYFMDLFASKRYFQFEPHKYGPYAHSIEVISRQIREFQKYYGTHSTEEAKVILYNKLVSDSVQTTMNELMPFIVQSCEFVNGIDSDHELECLATICYLIENKPNQSESDVIIGFKEWSDEKAQKFPSYEIIAGIIKLNAMNILYKSFLGYSIS